MGRSGDVERAGPARALPAWLAIVLVFGTSAAVLVVEILAGRLLAPYVGVSLETYTAIIGTVLTGIAIGAAVGGWTADQIDPRRLVPPLVGLGGALCIASIPLVRILGEAAGAGGGGTGIVMAATAFLPPAAALSAVPPVVVKLQLRDLGRTGTTVGWLSAFGTAGAIAGTFVAGFVLVAHAAVTTLIVAVGMVLIVGAVALWIAVGSSEPAVVASVLALVAAALAGVAWIDSPCDVQTAYYCVSVQRDPARDSGRVLVLDDLRHSYVDLADPTHLEFWYVRRIVDALDEHVPVGRIDVVSVGGGGLTIPRWIRATRPGSRQVVLELDPELPRLAERELGFRPGDDIEIRTGDARLLIGGVPAGGADAVVGDAFGSRAVPWHLATREFVEEVARVLRPDGVYVLNLIDEPTERFVRAAAATIARVLPFVAVTRSDGLLEGRSGNAVIVASAAPLDAASWDARRVRAGDGGALVSDIDDYIADAVILTDDFAPVDQLLAGTR
jgi:spermidine synthase/MFS family permease